MFLRFIVPSTRIAPISFSRIAYSFLPTTILPQFSPRSTPPRRCRDKVYFARSCWPAILFLVLATIRRSTRTLSDSKRLFSPACVFLKSESFLLHPIPLPPDLFFTVADSRAKYRATSRQSRCSRISNPYLGRRFYFIVLS